jgi:hypothetical protein
MLNKAGKAGNAGNAGNASRVIAGWSRIKHYLSKTKISDVD